MRRWFLSILAVVLFCALAGTALAAVDPKPIKVFVDGSPLYSTTAPVVVSGRTFVEMQTIFPKLGFEVKYDYSAKTVRATARERSVEWKPSETTALINGKTQSIINDMKVIKGYTMVSVRFISMLSGKSVAWDPIRRKIDVYHPVPSKTDELELYDAVKKWNETNATEKVDENMRLYTSYMATETVTEEQLRAKLKGLRLQTKFLTMKIKRFSPFDAVVYTKEEIRKTAGTAFHVDNRSDYLYTLHKDLQGQWKVDYFRPQSLFELLSEDNLWMQEVQAPGADKTAIESLKIAQIQAFNDRKMDYKFNLVNDRASHVSLPANGNLLLQYAEVKRMAIVDYSENSAVLLAMVEFIGPNDAQGARVVGYYHAVKTNEHWQFSGKGAEQRLSLTIFDPTNEFLNMEDQIQWFATPNRRL